MFSHRLPWNADVNALTRAIETLRASGAELIDLTVSNPTAAGLLYEESRILDALARPASLKYEPAPQGMAVAREAVASLRGIDLRRVFLTASTSEAYAMLFQLLADPGDEVLMPRPSYPLLDHLAALQSVHLRHYPLHYDHGWFIDFEALRSAITPRTRAVVVINPNNPTGHYLKDNEMASLDALCLEAGLALISDEVFFDYALDRSAHAVRVEGGRALAFSLDGLSKLIGLPQMKLGWIVLSGEGWEQAARRLELIADAYLSAGAPIQHALPDLLGLRTPFQAQVIDRLRGNLRALAAAVTGTACRLLDAEGGWYAVLRLPHTRSEEEWCLDLATLDHVIVQPGYYFDFESEPYVVLSLLTPPADFREGVRRIVNRVGG